MEQIAAFFEETARNEQEHARLWFQALHGDSIPSTEENLADAAAGENLNGQICMHVWLKKLVKKALMISLKQWKA